MVHGRLAVYHAASRRDDGKLHIQSRIDALLHLQEPVHAFPGNDFLQQPSFLFLYHNIHIHKGKSQPLGQQHAHGALAG